MKESDFSPASEAERREHVVRPYEQLPLTTLTEGAYSHLLFGQSILLSFLTMKAGTIFEIHAHPEEQLMYVIEGYCDQIVRDKIYRVQAGDVIYMPSNVPHGAFLREVDCKVIDVFSPPRRDYAHKFSEQNSDTAPRFRS